MIKLTSKTQAEQYRGQIPELAILRMSQLEGEDGQYDPEQHGYIAVFQEGDMITEISPQGLYDEDGLPIFEFVETFYSNGQTVFEVVIAVNTDFVIALIIPDEPWLDAQLRQDLQLATQGSTPAAL
jgi:hypothetical protein